MVGRRYCFRVVLHRLKLLLLGHLLTKLMLRVLLIFGAFHAARHKHKVESLDLLQVGSHAMLPHFSLERLSIGQLVFLQTGSQAWTPAPNPNQVSLVYGFTNIEHFDHFSSLPVPRLLLKYNLLPLLLCVHYCRCHWLHHALWRRLLHGLRMIRCIHGRIVCYVSCCRYEFP